MKLNIKRSRKKSTFYVIVNIGDFMERGTFKYFLVQSIATSLCGLVIFPLFDFLLDEFITHSKFAYKIADHIVTPIVFGFTFGLVFWLTTKKKK